MISLNSKVYRSSHVFFIIFLLAVSTMVSGVFAQSPQDDFLHGIREYFAGNFSSCINILQKVIDCPASSTEQKLEAYAYMGASYYLLGDTSKTESIFEKCISSDSSYVIGMDFPLEIRKLYISLKEKSYCNLYITSVPCDAKIYLSQSLLGTTPLSVKMIKGSYLFEAIPDEKNYFRESFKLDLSNDSLSYSVQLQQKAFKLIVKSNSRVDSIYFDDSFFGITSQTVEIYSYDRGSHTLTIKGAPEKRKEVQTAIRNEKRHVNVPFRGTYFTVGGLYDIPANIESKDLYSAFVGGAIGLGGYLEVLGIDGSFFYVQPNRNQSLHLIDTLGTIEKGDRVWRWGVDISLSLLIPFGYLSRGKYPVFPFGGIGYQYASSNVNFPGEAWTPYQQWDKSSNQNTQNWFYEAGLMFGLIYFRWRKTFEAQFGDWEGYSAGIAIGLK